MTLELVTKPEAYSHLRLDTAFGASDEDSWLDIFIPAISEAVAGWLKDEWRLYVPELDADGHPLLDSNGDQVPEVDSAGEMTPRWQVKAAVLVELDSAYRFRGGEGRDNLVSPDAGYGYVLNKASTAILAPLRKTTVA